MNRDRMVLLLDVLARVERGEAALMPDTDARDGKPVAEPPGEVRRLGFNMATWFCGTAACAAGHLCLDARAREQGLRLDKNVVQLVPHYEGKVNYDALGSFLGIDFQDTEYLFSPYEYLEQDPDSAIWQNRDVRLAAYRAITPAKVAERVREIMARERQEVERIANALRE